MEFIAGIAVGAAFAPFWMMVYNKFIKPTLVKYFGIK